MCLFGFAVFLIGVYNACFHVLLSSTMFLRSFLWSSFGISSFLLQRFCVSSFFRCSYQKTDFHSSFLIISTSKSLYHLLRLKLCIRLLNRLPTISQVNRSECAVMKIIRVATHITSLITLPLLTHDQLGDETTTTWVLNEIGGGGKNMT